LEHIYWSGQEHAYSQGLPRDRIRQQEVHQMIKLLLQLIASYLQKCGIIKTKTTDQDVQEFLEAHSKKDSQEK